MNKQLMRPLMLLVFLTAGSKLFAQGKVSIIGAEKLEQVISARTRSTNGYRIQVYFGSDRKTAEETREKIKQDFPGLSVYFLYQQPNYKIRVGNYTSIIQAQADLYRLAEIFTGAFIVSDQIEGPK